MLFFGWQISILQREWKTGRERGWVGWVGRRDSDIKVWEGGTGKMLIDELTAATTTTSTFIKILPKTNIYILFCLLSIIFLLCTYLKVFQTALCKLLEIKLPWGSPLKGINKLKSKSIYLSNSNQFILSTHCQGLEPYLFTNHALQA